MITELSFSDLPSNWKSLSLISNQVNSEHFNLVEVIFDADGMDSFIADNPGLKFPCLYFRFHAPWHQWKHPWSIADYGQSLEALIKTSRFNDLFFFNSHNSYFSFGHVCNIRQENSILSEEIAFWEKEVNDVVTQLENQLAAQAMSTSFVTRFNFPPVQKTACEQYLLYFVQFLNDLGIEAEANLNHQGNDVLFSVTPKDKEQALSSIRDALTAYICIPSSPTFASDAALSNDIAVRQLEANVYHLQGQIALNRSILQAKDATIDALQLTNFQQRQMLEVAAYNAKPVKDENESVMDGIVHITKYEGKGYIVDFPKIIRLLKRSFDI